MKTETISSAISIERAISFACTPGLVNAIARTTQRFITPVLNIDVSMKW